MASDWALTESVNISSGGVFLRTPEAILPGQIIEAWVAWPVLLDKHIPLRLVAKGAVVRNEAAGTAVRFETYEFRTGHVHSEARNLLNGLAADNRREASMKVAG